MGMSSDSRCGEVPEWSNGAVSKTVEGASLPRVRIPVSPPLNFIITVCYGFINCCVALTFLLLKRFVTSL